MTTMTSAFWSKWSYQRLNQYVVTIKNLSEDSQPPPLVHGNGNDRVDDILGDSARAGAGGVGRCMTFRICDSVHG